MHHGAPSVSCALCFPGLCVMRPQGAEETAPMVLKTARSREGAAWVARAPHRARRRMGRVSAGWEDTEPRGKRDTSLQVQPPAPPPTNCDSLGQPVTSCYLGVPTCCEGVSHSPPSGYLQFKLNNSCQGLSIRPGTGQACVCCVVVMI